MTQKSVELLIGKLVSDEELRDRFRREPRSTLEALQREGLELTPLEVSALLSLGARELERLAGSLDPRLQKLRSNPLPARRSSHVAILDVLRDRPLARGFPAGGRGRRAHPR